MEQQDTTQWRKDLDAILDTFKEMHPEVSWMMIATAKNKPDVDVCASNYGSAVLSANAVCAVLEAGSSRENPCACIILAGLEFYEERLKSQSN